MRITIVLLLACQVLFGQSISLVGAGYVNPIPVQVAPGQVVTFFLTGLQTVLPLPDRADRAPTVPLPLQLAGISATLSQSGPGTLLAVPLFSVEQLDTCSDPASMSPDCMLTAITLQIPFEMLARNPMLMAPVDLIGVTAITFVENGAVSRAFQLSPMMDAIHVLTNCGDALSSDDGALPCQSLVTHADGSLVSATAPAATGEQLVIYAYGLGFTTPIVADGAPSPWGALTNTAVRIDLDFRPNAGTSRPGYGVAATYQPTWVGLAAGQIGVYQVNFQVPQPPSTTPPCGAGVNSNLTVTIQGFQSFDGAMLCVATQ
ncbi:MAG: hypothetical protein ACLQGV_18370 [Bryobacteraceae bacterium]